MKKQLGILSLIFIMLFSYSANASAEDSITKKYAKIAKATYGGSSGQIGNFHRINRESLGNGFYAEVWADFSYKDEASKPYVIAFRGTDDWRDVIADVKTVVTSVSDSQIRSAENFVRQQLNKYGRVMKSLVLTGHSLGGYLAQWTMAQCADGKLGAECQSQPGYAATFNAPGFALLSPGSVYSIEVAAKLKRDKQYKYDEYIENFQITGDLVSAWGDNLGSVIRYKPTYHKTGANITQTIKANVFGYHEMDQFIKNKNF